MMRSAWKFPALAEAAMPASGIVDGEYSNLTNSRGERLSLFHQPARRPSAAMETLGTVHSTLESIDTGIASQPRGSTQCCRDLLPARQQEKLGSSNREETSCCSLRRAHCRHRNGNVLATLTAFAGPVRAADQALIDAARKEGSVTWYTAQTLNQVGRPLVDAFESKYGIKVNAVRADASDNAMRIAAEGAAGKMQADVFDGTTTAPALETSGPGAQVAAGRRQAFAQSIRRPRRLLGRRQSLCAKIPPTTRTSCRAAASRGHGPICSTRNGVIGWPLPERHRHRPAPVSSAWC